MKSNKSYRSLEDKVKKLTEANEKLAGLQGIFEKMKEQLKYDKDNPYKNYPISNSNIFQVKRYLDAWLKKKEGRAINLRLQFMWAKIRYFENLLEFKNDTFLEYYGHRLAQCCLFAGAGAVIEYPRGMGDELSNKVIMPISPIESDLNGNITKGKCFTGPFFAGLAKKSELDQKYFNAKMVTQKGISGSKAITKASFFKWESTGITFLWILIPFIEIIVKIINMLQINLTAGMFRYLYKFTGPPSEQIIREIDTINDPDTNIIILRKDTSDISKKDLSTINDGAKTPPNFFTQQDLAHFMNIMAYVTAEFTNLSEKTSERNINAEVKVNSSYFSISQMEFLREFKLGVYFYNKTFNKTAEVGFTYDIQAKEDAENNSTPGGGAKYQSQSGNTTTNKTKKVR